MIEIPKILQKDDYRFIILRRNDKPAIESGWSRNANYEYDHHKLSDYLNRGHNYGVLPRGGISFLDSDNSKILKDWGVLDLFKDTFTVKTGTGNHHFYFRVKDPGNFVGKIYLDDELGTHYGHIAIDGNFYVVGPNCIHPNGNTYEITNNVELVTLSRSEIVSAISCFDWERKTTEKHQTEFLKSLNKLKFSESGSYCERNNIDILDVFNPGTFKISGDNMLCEHPEHGSTTGTNLCLNPSKNFWYCFRHHVGGDPLMLHAVMEGLISCGDAGPGCLSDKETFKLTIKKFEKDKVDKFKREQKTKVAAAIELAKKVIAED